MDGIYQFNANLLWNSQAWDSGNLFVVGFGVNGTSTRHSLVYGWTKAFTSLVGNSTSVTLKLDATDYVNLLAYHDHGANQTIYTGGGDDVVTSFSGHLVASLT